MLDDAVTTSPDGVPPPSASAGSGPALYEAPPEIVCATPGAAGGSRVTARLALGTEPEGVLLAKGKQGLTVGVSSLAPGREAAERCADVIADALGLPRSAVRVAGEISGAHVTVDAEEIDPDEAWTLLVHAAPGGGRGR